MNDADLAALRLSLQLAGATTVILLLLGPPLAWWLARSRTRWAAVLESLVALPLVMPPTVLGFYLLILLAPDGPLGAAGLAFSFGGLVLGSVLFSLPFAVQPLRQAFAAIPESLLEAAAVLGAGPGRRWFTVALPLAWPGLAGAALLSFAHTLGEFGVVLMIGGSIPDETRVLSIALYEHAEALDFARAHQVAAVLLAVSWALMLPTYLLLRRSRGWL